MPISTANGRKPIAATNPELVSSRKAEKLSAINVNELSAISSLQQEPYV
jgi:hypothetical protein